MKSKILLEISLDNLHVIFNALFKYTTSLQYATTLII